MMIQTNRTLGMLAAVFSLLGVISTVSSLFLSSAESSTVVLAALPAVLISGVIGLFAFVGFILFLVAMYGFSKDYAEPKIFNYILYGLLAAIVTAVILVIVVVAVALSNLASIIPSLTPSATSPSQASNSLLTSMAPMLAVFSFVGLIWVVFNVLAYNLLAKKSEVPLFRVAAWVLLAGAIVNIAVGLVFAYLAYSGSIDYNTYLLAAIPGGLIQYCAWALLAVAFHRIKAPATQPYTVQYVPPAAGQVRYCQHCGNPNQTDATYCTRCGQKL